MRVALALAIAVLTLSAPPSDARACDDGPASSQTRSHLLGIDADGNYVQYHRSYGDSDSVGHGFVAYDSDGEVIATLDLDGGEPTGSYFSGVLQAQVSDPKIIEGDLIAAKQLEKPKPRRMRHVMTEARCGSLEIDSKSGWLRVAEVGTLSYLFPETCKAITVQGFEHPKVNVTFVHARFQIGSSSSGDSYVTHDRIHILPNTRIEAAELTLLAERARLEEDLDKAIPMVERAIRIAPEYLPARSSLIRTYAKDGRSWESLLPLLDAQILEGKSTIGAPPSKGLLKALPSMWKEAADHEGGWTWDSTARHMFQESFI